MGSRRKTSDLRAPCFTVLQWNAGGLSRSKMAELKGTIVEEEVDILIIQEANLTEENIKFYQIKDFTTYGLFKKRKVASGILVAVRNKLTSTFEVVKEMNDHDLAEIVVVKVWMEKTLFSVYGIYSPPNNKHLNLDVLNTTRNSLIVGDFNAASTNWGYKNRNQAGQTVEDFMDSNAMTLMYNSNDPNTFIHYSGSSTNPDLAMVSTNIADQCTKTVIGDPGSGHRMTKLKIELKTKLKSVTPRAKWNFKKAKWKDFTALVERLVKEIPNNLTPYQEAAAFSAALKTSAKQNIPRGRVFQYKPFWNDELKKQKEIRDRARENAEKVEGKPTEKCREDVIKWRKECAVMKRKINVAKSQSWNDFLDSMDYRTDGIKAYRLMDNLNNKKVQTSSHPMKIKNKEMIDPKVIAAEFNKFYINQYSHGKLQRKKERKVQKIILSMTRDSDRLFTEDFSLEELQMAIADLQKNKLPGADNIFPEFLKHLGQSATEQLLKIYNIFWNQNLNLPNDWVKATVIPIHKIGKPKESIKSYRPISLTSMISKTFEKMLMARLKFFLEDNDIIAEEQTGFRENMSTSNSILKVVHKIKSSFNDRKSTLAVLVDFQGAYDTVWRKRLINKLMESGIRNNMLSWIKRFLAQRWVKTRWNQAESNYGRSKVGLPQGAVSSCTLFNIYVNDLIKNLQSTKDINVSMFADDLIIWTEAKNSDRWDIQRKVLENTMNKALEILQIWAKDNNMIINNSKTVYQFFSLKHVDPDFDLTINDCGLINSRSSKYLGVVLDKKLSFKKHVNYIEEKAEKRLQILRRLAGAKWGCSQYTLNRTYNIYVKPILKYGSEVLLTAAQDKINILERLQNRALRIITGAVKTTPIAAMQLYTSNPPIHEEIKKQAISTYIRLKSSQRAKWIEECCKDVLKTQVSPIVGCQNIVKDLDENNTMDFLRNLVNPLEYTGIDHHLTLNGLSKKDNHDSLLKATAISLMEENYPEPLWTRIFTDGSQAFYTAGAGVYCKLFSQYAPVGKFMTNFDAEIYAIHLALQNLIFRINDNRISKVAIFVDSSAAIQAISTNHHSEMQIVTQIKKDINYLRSKGKQIVFQWIPSHVGIYGNEKADLLAKKGNNVLINQIKPVPPNSYKKFIHRHIINSSKDKLIINSKDKKWHNIQNSWKFFSERPRKEAVAFFRLETGHDCLAEHLYRIGVLHTNVCPICNAGVMNSEHLLGCPKLNGVAQQQRDIFKLYWDARALMD